MDSFIALTAAGALIEAVDFSVKILTTSRDLCRSEGDEFGVNQELQLVSEKLLGIQVKLSCLLNKMAQPRTRRRRFKTCSACSITISELLRSLEAARNQGYSQIWKRFGSPLS